MKKTILAFTMLAAFSMNAFSQKKEKDKVLANKTYTVDITETGSKKPKTEADEISFKSEKLNSKFMSSKHHFPAGVYTVSVDSSSSTKVISFESAGKNPDGEEIKWQGEIADESIEGTIVISKKGKTKAEYSFSGELKQKSGKK